MEEGSKGQDVVHEPPTSYPEPTPELKLQIVERVGNLPVVMSVVDHLGALYGYTKEANSFAKYGLETAASGVKITKAMAVPVVNKFGTPVSMLDAFAVSQLEKLEDHLPIITKPTPVVMSEAKNLYSNTVGPTVDRITSVTKYGVDSVNSVKDMGVSTVEGVKQKVHGAATYSKERVTDYGCQKFTQLLDTRAGQYAHQKMDQAITGCDAYVDYYLPENEAKVQELKEAEVPEKEAEVPENESEVQQDEEAEVQQEEPVEEVERALDPVDTWNRAQQLSWKAGGRVYNRGKTRVQKVIMRSQEAMQQLSFTVDLMEYAKVIDSGKQALQDGLVKSRDTVWSVWEQINEPLDDQAAMEPSSPSKTFTRKEAIQARLIASARIITSNIKNTVDSLPDFSFFVPKTVRNSIWTIRGKVNELYRAFAETDPLSKLSSTNIGFFQSLIASARNAMNAVLSQLSMESYQLPTPDDQPVSKEDDMEEPRPEQKTDEKALEEPEKPSESPVASPDDPSRLEPLAEDPNEEKESKKNLDAPMEDN